MKIAHIVCTYPPYFGGMGNAVFSLVEALMARGHEVEVFTPGYYDKKELRGPNEQPQARHHVQLDTQIATVHRLAPSLQYGNAARLPQIAHELDAFDVVHLHYPFFGTANVVRTWKIRNPHKKLVITYHMDAEARGWKGLVFSGYARFWMPKVLAAADLLIASSFDFIEHSQARTLHRAAPERWKEIPFGVDTERFSLGDKRSDLLRDLNMASGTPIVLFVGGMDSAHHFKGIPTLLKALVLLKKVQKLPQVVLVGDGALRESYMLQAQGMGLAESVRFVGSVSNADLPDYYRLANVCVLPSTSRAEAFGLVLLEAMASGVPVVASDLPGVRTIAQKGGSTFPVRDYGALADQIAAACFGGALPSAEVVRSIALREYSWPKIAEQHEQVYTTLA